MNDTSTQHGGPAGPSTSVSDDVIYGTVGVLAYDAVTDRVQCHACGQWYRKLTISHLAHHGLTISGYKHRYGLNPTTPLESPHTSALRRGNLERAVARNTLPIDDDTLYGEIGVLAYDDVADRIQCHACGRWFHKLNSTHLTRHGLSISEYKERYGLNDSTPLETPRITALRQRYAEQYETRQYLIPASKGHTLASVWKGRKHRAQYTKVYLTPEARKAKGERQQFWTDEELLADLKTVQAACGGHLTLRYLRHHRPTGSERVPSHHTVVLRFGSWKRVCELLGQPYRIGRPKSTTPGADRYWSDDEIIARLRALKEQCGGVLTASALQRYGSGRKGHVSEVPSYRTVYLRFGSWQRISALLGQPYNPGNQHTHSGKPA